MDGICAISGCKNYNNSLIPVQTSLCRFEEREIAFKLALLWVSFCEKAPLSQIMEKAPSVGGTTMKGESPFLFQEKLGWLRVKGKAPSAVVSRNEKSLSSFALLWVSFCEKAPLSQIMEKDPSVVGTTMKGESPFLFQEKLGWLRVKGKAPLAVVSRNEKSLSSFALLWVSFCEKALLSQVMKKDPSVVGTTLEKGKIISISLKGLIGLD